MRDIKFRAFSDKRNRYIDMYWDFDIVDGVLIYEQRSALSNKKELAIEQYTGLKDVNGVEIYENDIVRQQMRFTETNGIIFWQEEKARFAINLDGFITTITKPQEMSYEVVGNIHNNPELLEETT